MLNCYSFWLSSCASFGYEAYEVFKQIIKLFFSWHYILVACMSFFLEKKQKKSRAEMVAICIW